LFLSVHFPNLLLSFGRGLLIPVLPLFVTEFGVGYGLIGLALAGAALGTVLADLPAGMLLRRFDPKLVMVVGMVVLGISVLALFWCSTVWQVILARVASGVGTALWSISLHSFVAEVTKPRGRGREIALFGGLSRAGVFIGPAVGGVVAGLFGLRVTFLAYVFLVLIGLVAAIMFIRRNQAHKYQPRSSRSALLMIYRNRNAGLAGAGVGQIMVQLVRRAREAIIPLYAADVIGLEVEAVGWVVSGSSFVDMLMFPLAGYIMDRFGRKFAIIPSFLIQGIGLAAIPLAASFTGILLIGVVIGIGNGLASGSMMTVGADLAPPEALGEFLGIWRLIGDTGATSGPLLVGIVAGAVSLPLAAILAGTLGCFAAATFAVFVPETLPKRNPV
jgi:MFS family permease